MLREIIHTGYGRSLEAVIQMIEELRMHNDDHSICLYSLDPCTGKERKHGRLYANVKDFLVTAQRIPDIIKILKDSVVIFEDEKIDKVYNVKLVRLSDRNHLKFEGNFSEPLSEDITRREHDLLESKPNDRKPGVVNVPMAPPPPPVLQNPVPQPTVYQNAEVTVPQPAGAPAMPAPVVAKNISATDAFLLQAINSSVQPVKPINQTNIVEVPVEPVNENAHEHEEEHEHEHEKNESAEDPNDQGHSKENTNSASSSRGGNAQKSFFRKRRK